MKHLELRVPALIGLCAIGTVAAAQDFVGQNHDASDAAATASPIGAVTLAGEVAAIASTLTVRADLHDAADSDWYIVELRDESLAPDCGTYRVKLHAWLSDVTSPEPSVQSLLMTLAWNVNLPGQVVATSPPQRATLDYLESSCGSTRTAYVSARRPPGVTATAQYTLNVTAEREYFPMITGISPTSGPIGTAVTIAGRDLLPHVLFQGAVATISSYSPTSVTATVPPGATTGPIGMHDRTFTHVFIVTRSRATDAPATSAESSGARPGVERGGGSVTLPGGTLPRAPGANPCCTVVANPALAGRLGRLVVAFPADAVPTGTRVVVLKDGKEVQAGYGSQSWDLLAGTYDVGLSGKIIANVTVQARSDTNVRVGVLRVSASDQTRAEVLDGDTVISGDYGDQLVGLPAGSYGIRIAGQTETFTIEEGGVTDF